MTQSDSIPAEWIQAAADAIRRACVGQYNAETPVAPNEEWRAIATAAITILRPLIEAETRTRLHTMLVKMASELFAQGEFGRSAAVAEASSALRAEGK